MLPLNNNHSQLKKKRKRKEKQKKKILKNKLKVVNTDIGITSAHLYLCWKGMLFIQFKMFWKLLYFCLSLFVFQFILLSGEDEAKG